MKSLKDLQIASRVVFEANKKADKLLATADGQFFLPNSENAAKFHAKQAGGKKPLKVYEITRKEAFEVKKEVEEAETSTTSDETQKNEGSNSTQEQGGETNTLAKPPEKKTASVKKTTPAKKETK